MTRTIIARGVGTSPAGPPGPPSTIPGPQGDDGPQGPRGLPGVNAVENDEAVATYIANPDSQVGQAFAVQAGAVGSAVAPTPTAGASWLSSRYADLQVSNAVGDRRVILRGTLAHESTAVQEPSVWVANGRYNMVHTGGYGGPVLCYAWCPTTADPTVSSNWTKASAPILGNGNGGQAGGAFHSWFYIEGPTIHLFYVPKAAPTSIRRATASLSTTTPVFTDQGVALAALPDSNEMGNGSIVKIGSTYYMLYEASTADWQMSLATSSSITGTFTPTGVGEIHSLWPRRSTVYGARNVGGPCLFIEDGQVVCYYHSGPKISGSVPTEGYRATIPVADFQGGEDSWVIDNNRQPILHRAAPEECDQVADLFVFANPDTGERFITWTGFDNERQLAVVLCQRMTPAARSGNGASWAGPESRAGGLGTAEAQKPNVVELVNNVQTPANTVTDVLSATFRPTGPSMAAAVTCTGARSGANGTVKFRVTVSDDGGNTVVRYIGSSYFTNSYQTPFSGTTKFSGLNPGETYTVKVSVLSVDADFLCRPQLNEGADERMTLNVFDAAFPGNTA